MEKAQIEIRPWFLKQGREVRGVDGNVMGYGMTCSQLEALGASRDDLENSVIAGIISKCYIRLTTFSLELFYYAAPKEGEELGRDPELEEVKPAQDHPGMPESRGRDSVGDSA
mgnify:CR=1 FL=1